MSKIAPQSIQERLLGSNRGFVLVAVIWISGLLALSALTFAIRARTNTLLARNLASGTRAMWIADGFSRLLALRLTKAPASANGEPTSCIWEDGSIITYTTQDQAGLVDLNASGQDLLEHLLVGLGASPDKAAAISSKILEFRASVSASVEVSNGANYEGRDFGPKGTPFESPVELDQIPGLEPALVEQLQNLTTVYSQNPGFDESVAPKELLLAIKASGANPKNFAWPSNHKVYGVAVMVETPNKTRFDRNSIVALTQQAEQPFTLLSWSQPMSAIVPAPAAATLKPCVN